MSLESKANSPCIFSLYVVCETNEVPLYAKIFSLAYKDFPLRLDGNNSHAH